jgi:glycerol-3-phosphate dehydrogenase
VPALATAPVHFTNAGVRALVRQEGSESSVSRSHRLADGDREGSPGLVSVVGGKLTGYRAIAEEVVDLVCARLRNRAACVTAEHPLPGGGSTGWAKGPTAVHLVALYGSRAGAVEQMAASEPGLGQPLAAAYPDIAGQVVWAVREEQCVRLTDFLLRRTRLGFSQDQGRTAVATSAQLLARELGWTEARHQAELAEYDAYVMSTQRFRTE